MARRTKRLPRDPLDGYRSKVDTGPEAEESDDGRVLPLNITEMDALDMAEETRRELAQVKGPLRYVLQQAFDQSRQANLALVECDAFDAVTIRRLQGEVQRFRSLVRYVVSTLVAGKLIEAKHTEDQIEEALQLLRDAGEGD